MSVVSSGRRPGSRWPKATGLVGLFALLISLIGAPLTASAQQVSSTSDNWAPPTTVYIPQTGQSIDGVFLDFWRANNGIANYGYPVTPEFTKDDGHIAQYYQYARFEYWPEAEDGQVTRLGNLGEDLRPKSLQRNSIASTGSTDTPAGTSANAEVAQMTRAWLPLDARNAKRKNSDTYVYIKETKHSISNGFKTWWDMTGGTTYLGNPLTQEYILKGTTYQVFERGQLAWEKDKGVWLVPLGEVLAQQHQISTDPVAQGNLPAYSEDLFVKPKPKVREGNGGERWIEVNLSTQYLIAWEGDVSVAETYVSTGRPGFDTPPGTYHILVKLESQTMEGVIGGEYYNVPDVPWVQYFTNYGHALHGTYWHNNFGATMSHGCVNLPMDFAQWLYGWTSIGTRVEIHF
jgi:lipoprotein-anchoring transpeptidase ErfK/SrfK